MKSFIKLSVAALLVVGSTQVSANDGQFDLTQTLSNSIASYIESSSNELKVKLKQSLFTDSQNTLNELLQQQTEQFTADSVTEDDNQFVVANTASNEE
ncbi:MULTISPECIES: hypothetical protein [unclassified Pseudoalteromonas]|uniref:hypothetical protein n=1 Tax=unclassified Pseudoalteromonas TaxID=194690 RepID=UPI000B3C5C16|nr:MULTISPECIES: hypothetical protein [unclassified Pseudoalteromonas]MDN3379884.1 hypothetical protein [Pseudoalteromonas sp. APC 3893]MDN3388223.1 hypothetical protein [Pseudoalteromonas sp. APC 4017]OUS73543.1 hypothetical protein B5G52_04670 [Pseudoalteromonas sp. A601]